MIKLNRIPKVDDRLKCKRPYNIPSRVMKLNYCDVNDIVVVKKVTYFSIILVNPRNHTRFKLPINLICYYFDEVED